MERRVRASPADILVLNEFLGLAGELDEVERTERLLSQLTAEQPQHPVLLTYWAQALGNLGQFDRSLEIYERALSLAPELDELHVAYGTALLRQGDFQRGWPHYEYRESILQRQQSLVPPKQPWYSGGNLHGKTILLLGEQGIGDTVMMARYAPLLVRRGAKVAFAAHASIRELLRAMPGVWRVTALGEQVPQCDRCARLLTLPLVFGTNASNIPDQVPYLRAASSRIKRWQEELASHGPGRRVALIWAGSSLHNRNGQRSMHLRDLSPLVDVKGVTFFALQKGYREEESAQPPEGMRLVNLAPKLEDFSDLAAVLQLMDLLISTDTGPVHLAGALARPVWTLLSYSPDWRWLIDRADSPWYPTMRLFRQPKLRDWGSVIASVRVALEQWVPSHQN